MSSEVNHIEFGQPSSWNWRTSTYAMNLTTRSPNRYPSTFHVRATESIFIDQETFIDQLGARLRTEIVAGGNDEEPFIENGVESEGVGCIWLQQYIIWAVRMTWSLYQVERASDLFEEPMHFEISPVISHISSDFDFWSVSVQLKLMIIYLFIRVIRIRKHGRSTRPSRCGFNRWFMLRLNVAPSVTDHTHWQNRANPK